MTADHGIEGRLVDWTLGELSAEEECEVRRQVHQNPKTALAAAETRAVIEDLRTLTVEPTGRLELALRYAVLRDRRLSGGGPGPARGGSFLAVLRSPGQLARVAAVAAVVLFGLLQFRDYAHPKATPPTPVAAAVTVTDTERIVVPDLAQEETAAVVLPDTEDVLIVAGDSLRGHYDALQKLSELDAFARLVRANNELELLRLEFTQRFSRRARRDSIAMCGGKPDLEDRIQDLAAAVAAEIQRELREDRAAVDSVAIALRALLAAGSTHRIGVHRAAVGGCVAYLETHIAELEGGDLATALAALTDFAVITGGRAGALVGEHSERLALSTVIPREGRSTHAAPASVHERGRPALLQFHTSVASLADAGRVLGLAPAFGADPVLSRQARLCVGAHLKERLTATQGERPGLLAAMLYGFGDLLDPYELDNQLLLWRPQLLAGSDLMAVHHLSWSQFPPRPGWTKFQRDLRELATLRNPDDIRDAAALLLSLTMNFAAPGVRRVLQLAG